MITSLQKTTAQAIVNIFETGCVAGDYARVSLVTGDGGHLSYGRAQASLASGNLGLLVSQYCATPGAAHADALRPCLERLHARDISLDEDSALRSTLVMAGADPVMHTVQDQFFDRLFWEPALRVCATNYIQLPLGIAVMFDSFIHGSWYTLRMSVNAKYGRPPTIREECWIEFYVKARRRFLCNSRAPLPQTAYRMEAFEELIQAGNWTLHLPITVRGVIIAPEAMDLAA